MYSAMISLVFLAGIASTHCKEAIHCTLRKSEHCCVDESREVFGSTPDVPAPVPDSLMSKDSGDGKLHIEWTQRKSQLQDVEGYYVEVVARNMDGAESFILSINSSLIIQNSQDNETLISFTFDDALFVPFSMIIVTLYAMPLYNPYDEDYYLESIIRASSPANPSVRPKTSTLPSTTSPLTNAMTTLPSSQPTTTEGEGDIRVDMVPIIVTTNMATASLVLLCILAWKRCLRRKRKSAPESLALAENGAQKGNQSSKRNRSILVLTDSEERDDAGSNRDYFKRIALCLANTLQSSGEFDVSCNLWMTENISEKGVAIWAHDVMKVNDKVIILCNSDESKKSNENAYAILIQNLVKSTEFDGSKFLIICTEERPSHKCFTKMDLQALKICRHFKLKRNLDDVVKSLRKEGLERRKIEKMNHVFAQMMAKMDVKHHSNHRQEVKHHGIVYEVVHKNDSTYQETAHLKQNAPQKNRNRQFSKPSTSEGKTETQFDSLYSSRCNSQSSETVSSGEEKGCLDHPHGAKGIRSCSNPKTTGAKPKKKEIVETDCL